MKLFRISIFLIVSLLLFSCASLSTEKYGKKAISDLPSKYFSSGINSVWESAGNGIYQFRFRDNETGLTVDAVKIDLFSPGREVVVSRGVEPAGDDTGNTMNFRSKTINCFMKDSGVLTAINANPFDPYRFFAGQRQSAVGIVLSDGIIYSGISKYAALFFQADNRAEIYEPPFPSLSRWRNGVGGFFVILHDGNVTSDSSIGDTRSIAGKDRTGRYVFLAVVGSGNGITFREAAEWIKYLGAEDALLLDGGGSSVLAVRDGENGKIRILNNLEGGSILYFKRLAPVFLGIK